MAEWGTSTSNGQTTVWGTPVGGTMSPPPVDLSWPQQQSPPPAPPLPPPASLGNMSSQGIFAIPPQPVSGPGLLEQTEAMLKSRDQALANGQTPPPLTAGSAPVHGSDGNRTAQEAMVEAGQLIQKMSQFALLPLQFLPGIGVLATGADAFMNFVQGNVVGLGLDLLAIGLSGNYGYTYQGGNCFPAGTPLLTPTGDKAIEQFRIGDQILSRSEWHPDGELEAKVVEEVFVRTARIVRMRVCGHEVATTAEHPFWVKGKGWQMVSELRPGDLLSSHDGQWVALQGVWNTGEEVVVYNLRIADYHSYFVGARHWGFSVWAHNALYEVGEFGDLAAEAGVHRHHVPQVVAGIEALEGFTREIGPAIKIPDWMHGQIQHVTREEFLQSQGGNIIAHIGDHLRQLRELGVPMDALDALRRQISWWF